MKETGKISEREYAEATASPLTVTRFPNPRAARRSSSTRAQAVEGDLSETQLTTRGCGFFTTLDTIMQRSAEERG